MLTLDALKERGENTTDGLMRCMNDEGFYLKMVSMALQDDSFDLLKSALEAGDLDAGFERAHALKGVMGNVGLTTLFDPIAEMTEELRARKDIDYSGYIETIFTELDKLRAL